jgi:hypothetical protein
MKKLKSKLKAMAIYNSAVCNCHKDDEFTPLLNLVETGYMFTNRTKTTSERISYGIKLRQALNKFNKIFVPHMKEEEEIFQPLLQKYFSRVELADMKNIVIKLHMQRRKLFSNRENLTITINDMIVGSIVVKKPLKISSNFREKKSLSNGIDLSEVNNKMMALRKALEMAEELYYEYFSNSNPFLQNSNVFNNQVINSSNRISFSAPHPVWLGHRLASLWGRRCRAKHQWPNCCRWRFSGWGHSGKAQRVGWP